MERVVLAAVNRGAIVVAAAGNDGPQGPPTFPAALEEVITVTAVDATEQIYAAATRGPFIALAALGVEIVSTAPGNQFVAFSGTSAAAPFASGAVALLLQQQPSLSRKDVQNLLERTAKDLGPPGKDPQFGSGLLDICRAMSVLSGHPLPCGN